MENIQRSENHLSSEIRHKKEQKYFNLYFFRLSLFQANLCFAFIAIAGIVGQTVSLPLWLSASQSKHKGLINANTTSPSPNYAAKMDAYFVLSFASLSFVVIFGLMYAILVYFYPHFFGPAERRFPHKLLFAIGLCDALNGALVVFASPPSRTAPYLQAILGNFSIPLTILARFIILKKKPTQRKFVCGMMILMSLFICMLPSIFPKQLDPYKKHEEGQGASGIAGVLWPLCFMFGFAPGTLMYVIEEKVLKMQDSQSLQRINIVYFLFWQSVYQLFSVLLMFWVDVIPGYGFTSSFEQFGKNWWFGLQCFFGSAGCDSDPGARGTMFILMYVLAYVGGGLLMRYTEGATLLSIVFSLVTPLGFLFWTLFKPEPFGFSPAVHVSTYYSIGALVIMVPAIYFYNTGAPEMDMSKHGRQEYLCASNPSDYHTLGEQDPLVIIDKNL
ncbi:uncharacterized protein LOC110239198 [Exaiptasia diaphana]|uniref:Uncharacterized protein n=1 Tax=Exaiptasia diaphana TaxID=2652724 RepID=A0A913X8K0_EXADI|nr:uncharacterized protein LOC110239198 [Exaiptasia diaphana]